MLTAKIIYKRKRSSFLVFPLEYYILSSIVHQHILPFYMCFLLDEFLFPKYGHLKLNVVLSLTSSHSYHNLYAPFHWCRYAAVFAAFVAGMACLAGIDFSAKLIASVAKSFEVRAMNSKLEADLSGNVPPSKQHIHYLQV